MSLIFRLHFQMHDEMNLITLSLALADILCAIIVVFVGCELGQRLSNAFEEIIDEFEKFHWYLFPIGINRSLPMLMSEAQAPVEMEVFGSITCCRPVMNFVSDRS